MGDVELILRCREFVEQQACGEWTDAIIAEDAKKLFEFVKAVTHNPIRDQFERECG